MQAVILAAGRGTRMGELTSACPKPLLKNGGVSLLERTLTALPESIDEIFIVVGYKGDMIRAQFGNEWQRKKIQYREQETLDGTAGALQCVAEDLTGTFLVLMGDDAYGAPDIAACVTAEPWAMGVWYAEEVGRRGRMVVENGLVQGIEIGVGEPEPGYINTGMYLLDARIFEYPLIAVSDTEYGLPHTVLAASLGGGIPLHAHLVSSWKQITSPEDLR